MLQIILSFLAAIRVFVRSRSDTALEILALRQQVAVPKRKRPRPKLNSWDRLFWTALRQCWSRWADVLVLVKPDPAPFRCREQGFGEVIEPVNVLRVEVLQRTDCRPIQSEHGL